MENMERTKLLPESNLPQGTGDEELDKVLEMAGYAYDQAQDIFISTLNPWQRNAGYCRLFDEAAAPLGMIIDVEPILFEYQGKKWMVGIWKGQYDLVTGGEIGIYKAIQDIEIPGIFKGTFYTAVSDEELWEVSYTLKKNGSSLFTRTDRHWWLTGFKLGEFSEPSELEMEITITLKDEELRNTFISGLKNAGYSSQDIEVVENRVQFTFTSPKTPQPITRNPQTDRLIQMKNKVLCETYQEIANPYPTMAEKIKAVQEEAPEIYQLIMRIGKNHKYLEAFTLMVKVGILLLIHMTRVNQVF